MKLLGSPVQLTLTQLASVLTFSSRHAVHLHVFIGWLLSGSVTKQHTAVHLNTHTHAQSQRRLSSSCGCWAMRVAHVAAGLRLAAVTLHDVLEGDRLFGDLQGETNGRRLKGAALQQQSHPVTYVSVNLSCSTGYISSCKCTEQLGCPNWGPGAVSGPLKDVRVHPVNSNLAYWGRWTLCGLLGHNLILDTMNWFITWCINFNFYRKFAANKQLWISEKKMWESVDFAWILI